MNVKNRGLSLPAAVLIFLLALSMAACASMLAQPNPTSQPVLEATPTVINQQESSVIAAAKSALAERLQVSVDGIQFVDIQPAQWPDGCLGVQQPGIMCAMHVVDGYRIMLSANDQTYEVRSNLDGSQTALALENASSSSTIQTIPLPQS